MNAKFIFIPIICLLFLSCSESESQVNTKADKLYSIIVNEKWGFIDKTGKVIVEPRYDFIEEFKDGYAAVFVGDKMGFIDLTGNLVIEPQFEALVFGFDDGYAIVEKDNVIFLIDTTGEIMHSTIEKPEDFLTDEENSYFEEKWGFLENSEIHDIGTFNDGLASYQDEDRKYGYIKKNGEIIVDPIYDKAASFSEGLAVVTKDDKAGFIDTTGKIVIPLQFKDEVGEFKNGMAKIEIEDRYGFIDRTGNFRIKPIYDEVTDFEEGLAAVKTNNKWGFVNSEGEFVIKLQYMNIGVFYHGLAPVLVDGKWGSINKKGEIVVQPQFYDRVYFDENGIGYVDTGGRWGYINKKGEIQFLIGKRYDYGKWFSESLAVVRDFSSNKAGFIDKSGNLAIEPKFDNASSFYEGLASVTINKKCGYINKEDEFVIEPTYDWCSYFSEGLTIVFKDSTNSYSVIDTLGNQIFGPIEKRVSAFMMAWPHSKKIINMVISIEQVRS